MQQCNNATMRQCHNAQLPKCHNAKVPQCSNARMPKCHAIMITMIVNSILFHNDYLIHISIFFLRYQHIGLLVADEQKEENQKVGSDAEGAADTRGIIVEKIDSIAWARVNRRHKNPREKSRDLKSA